MATSNNSLNRLAVTVRDASCGCTGGIRCTRCGNRNPNPSRNGVRFGFNGLIRTRVARFVERDLDRNPAD